MRIVLNGHKPPSPEMGKVGAVLGAHLQAAGHELVATEGEADVMVDFTAPAAVVANVLRAIAAGVPSVVGTTGWSPSDVEGTAQAAGVPVFVAPNFAIGAVLMMRFAQEAAPHFAAAEIVELHHEAKVDAPSGTARATADAMSPSTRSDVPIHSVRLPGLVAHQEVILGGSGETLTIRHDTTSREAFVPGVLLAVAKVRDLPPGVTIGLESLL